jgi:hypothetical protein
MAAKDRLRIWVRVRVWLLAPLSPLDGQWIIIVAIVMIGAIVTIEVSPLHGLDSAPKSFFKVYGKSGLGIM